MTTKEAIDELILDVDFILEEIEDHEEFEDSEQEEMQVQIYEDNKKKLEAYQVIFGAIDPSLSTVEGLRNRCEQVRMEKYGSSDAGKLPDPSEEEVELADILSSTLFASDEDEFSLDDDENAILAKINVEKGGKHVVVDDDPSDVPEPCESDTFTFYVYRGRVQVIYNNYADGDFCEYPIEFQEKALEIIKKKLENS